MKHPCLLPCLSNHKIVLQFPHISKEYTERDGKYGADNEDKFVSEISEFPGHGSLWKYGGESAYHKDFLIVLTMNEGNFTIRKCYGVVTFVYIAGWVMVLALVVVIYSRSIRCHIGVFLR